MSPATFTNYQADTLPDTTLLSCQIPGTKFFPCYGPGQIRAAYDIPSSSDGTGTTIVIIDGFQSPSVQTDLAAFDSIFGLQAPSFQVIAPDGTTAPDGSQLGWFIEEAVDVEWAHAIAPRAALILVEAKTGDDGDILSATKYAVDHNLGDVISMSFSEAESCPTAAFLADEHATFERAIDKGTTLVAASGDNGAAERACDGTLVRGVATPASDPLVTAVGGTTLTADPISGAYGSEVAWSRSGGGFSSIYRRPGYQAPFQKNNKARGLPDVSLSADQFGFGPTVATGRQYRASGTSLATAEWAGIAALSVQATGHRLGVLNVNLYHAAKSHDASTRFHDITQGTNSSTAFPGASAGPGWDAVTGLGTPDVAKLVAWIAKTRTIEAD